MIQLTDVLFSYPKSDFKLSIRDLTFAEGSKTAIIGPSGFGKTTMLNLIAGILLPDAGFVKMNAVAINTLSEVERRNYRIQNVGFVFQDFRLVPYLSVLDNILLPYRINNSVKPDLESANKAISIANDLNIGSLIRKYPARLSHGERQRVAIARALINKPRVLLADEPTGNLDPVNKLHIREILFEAVAKHQATLVTVTHDHEMLTGFDNVIDFKDLNEVAVS